MKCSLCGYQFREKDGGIACKGCPMAGKCHMLRCPNCGYDMPVESKLLKALKAWSKRDNGTK